MKFTAACPSIPVWTLSCFPQYPKDSLTASAHHPSPPSELPALPISHYWNRWPDHHHPRQCPTAVPEMIMPTYAPIFSKDNAVE
jgi:hypothetical protein